MIVVNSCKMDVIKCLKCFSLLDLLFYLLCSNIKAMQVRTGENIDHVMNISIPLTSH